MHLRIIGHNTTNVNKYSNNSKSYLPGVQTVTLLPVKTYHLILSVIYVTYKIVGDFKKRTKNRKIKKKVQKNKIINK